MSDSIGFASPAASRAEPIAKHFSFQMSQKTNCHFCRFKVS
jgi:hypothetical protein